MTVNINELSKNLIQRFVKKSSDDSLISLARGDIKKAKKDLDGADKAKKLLKKPINELSKDTLNKFITKALEKNAQNYVSGQVNKNIIQKHVKYTKVAHAKIEKKDQAELKKIMGESAIHTYIKDAVKRKSVVEDEAPTNAMGNSSSTQGPIQTFDPLLGAKKKKKILKRSIPKEI
jgi:hypothetical protein